MSKIQIICTKPGMRRNGIEHSATATYEPDYWTSTQINAFKGDPSFFVQEIDDGAVITRGPEFDQIVAAEVTRLIAEKTSELQATFNSAVADAVQERLQSVSAQNDVALKAGMSVLESENGELKAANETLGAQLQKAGEEIAALKAAAAKPPTTKR